MNPVLRLSKNLLGRDIVTGDIHGSFKLLKEALIAINFNPNVDRLIVAGDLMDRGPNSKVAAQWLNKDWFFAAMGNHDAQYAFYGEEHLFGSKGLVCVPVDPWYVEIPEVEMHSIFQTLRNKTHPAIEIETEIGLVGIVHACVPEQHNWSQLREKINAKDYSFFHDCIWKRDSAKLALRDTNPVTRAAQQIKDVAHVFHGHTPSSSIDYKHYSIGNRYFIDTGAYKANKPEKYPTAGVTLFDARYPNTPIYGKHLDLHHESSLNC